MPQQVKSSYRPPASVRVYRGRGPIRLRRPIVWLLSALVLAVLGVAVLGIFRVRIARAAARAWVVDERPVPSDAIVLLSGGVPSRPLAAAWLFNHGYAPLIVGTDIYIDPELVTPETSVTSAILTGSGVPKESVVWLTPTVNSTLDEAMAVLEWARANHAQRVIVTTDPFHTRRAKWVFRQVLGASGIDTVVVAAQPRDYSVDEWWRSETGLIEFQNEIIKFVYYRFHFGRTAAAPAATESWR